MYDFLDKLVNQVVRSAFFQNEPKDIVNLLKLPLIMPNGLVGKMINTESSKKSIMNNVHHYKSSVFTNFVKMISTDQLNILAIDEMAMKNPQHLRKIAKEIGIKVKDKLNVVLAEEMTALAKTFLAGQGAVVSIIEVSLSLFDEKITNLVIFSQYSDFFVIIS